MSPPNRLGFAVQLCYMRYPGIMLLANEDPPPALLEMAARQLRIAPSHWADYGRRDKTRREHQAELQAVLQVRAFTMADYRTAVQALVELAQQTDKGIILVMALIDSLRQQALLLPGVNVIERICAEAVTRATRRIYQTLTEPLTDHHRQQLDQLLQRRPDGRLTWLAWLRLTPGKASSRQMLQHINRLKMLRAIGLPEGIERLVHQNRLLKIAREGAQMTPHDLAKFEQQRRHATLTAIVVEARATVTDEIVDLHDRILGRLFNLAKKKHREQFHLFTAPRATGRLVHSCREDHGLQASGSRPAALTCGPCQSLPAPALQRIYAHSTLPSHHFQRGTLRR